MIFGWFFCVNIENLYSTNAKPFVFFYVTFLLQPFKSSWKPSFAINKIYHKVPLEAFFWHFTFFPNKIFIEININFQEKLILNNTLYEWNIKQNSPITHSSAKIGNTMKPRFQTIKNAC